MSKSHLKEDLYLACPVILQNALVTLAGFVEHHRRYSGVYHEYSRFLLANEFKSRGELRAQQETRLEEILHDAVAYVPYYRELGITNQNIDNFPVLDRSLVAGQSDFFVSEKYNPGELITVFTGGSTGTPIGIRMTKDVRRKTYAFWNRFYQGIGFNLGDRKATFLGRKIQNPEDQSPPFWRHNLRHRQVIFSSFHMTAANLPLYVERLNRLKPALIEGYPLSVFRVAEFIRDHELEIDFEPLGITTSSENFTEPQRACMEEVFGCKVFDQYGSAESVVFGGDCEFGRKHLATEYGYAEILTDDGRIEPEGEGELIVTTLLNDAMPLIRYRIGDLGRISHEACPCGRSTPLLEHVYGKVGAVLVSGDSRVSTAAIAFAFEYLPGVSKAQIVQNEPDRILVKIAAPNGFSDSDQQFMEWEIRKMLGEVMKIDVERVADIPPGPNGKYQMVVQNYYTES